MRKLWGLLLVAVVGGMIVYFYCGFRPAHRADQPHIVGDGTCYDENRKLYSAGAQRLAADSKKVVTCKADGIWEATQSR